MNIAYTRGATIKRVRDAKSSPLDGLVSDAPLQNIAATGQVAVLLLADIANDSRLWGYSRFVTTRFVMRDVLGLRFHKMLGSGSQGGFGLKPSVSRQGLFCVFESSNYADLFLANELVQDYRRHCREFFSVKLCAYSCKGAWAGHTISPSCDAPDVGLIASLTRASIRPITAHRFWRKQPAAEVALRNANGCLLSAGVGEAPLLRQATFSIWESAAAMDAYARGGAHLEAIRAAHAGKYFSESMFARFVPYDLRGVYNGERYG